MGEKRLSSTAVLGLLKGAVREKGGTRAVASEIGVSPSFITAVLAGEKPLGRRIPAYFRLTPVTLYEWDRTRQP